MNCKDIKFGTYDCAYNVMLHISRMKELGYKVYFNSCRPGDEDSFIPKTKLKYGDIEKGFNW